MLPISDTFDFDYFGSDVVFGRGRVGELKTFLEERGLGRAMVVTGTHVGANQDVVGPIEDGLGDHLAGVFAETTPEKSAETVFAGIDAMGEYDADVLVGVGGGSSLDVARQISAYAADGRPLSAYREAARDGRLEPPSTDGPTTPVVVIPTTLSGADVSDTGAVAILPAEETPSGETIRLHGSVTPAGMFYDPDLFETTPERALSGSAMNGFDKAVETLYANNGSPITDGTAVHSLRLFRESLPRLTDDDPDAIDRAVVATVLAQFQRRISVIHSFGHGVSRHHPVHQGLVHAVVAPHALQYIFERVDGGRDLLAMGLGVTAESQSADERADAVVDAVVAIRDSLGLPSRLRDLEVVPEGHIPTIAELTLADAKMEQAPDGLAPTVEDLEDVLRRAW